MYSHVEVEPNENCAMSANLVFKNLDEPLRVTVVRLFDGRAGGALHAVTGWSSAGGGTPVDAFAVRVEDSGAGFAYLVYGADWGIRLRPLDSREGWRIEDAGQLGETHLVLADAEDLIAAAAPA